MEKNTHLIRKLITECTVLCNVFFPQISAFSFFSRDCFIKSKRANNGNLKQTNDDVWFKSFKRIFTEISTLIPNYWFAFFHRKDCCFFLFCVDINGNVTFSWIFIFFSQEISLEAWMKVFLFITMEMIEK